MNKPLVLKDRITVLLAMYPKLTADARGVRGDHRQRIALQALMRRVRMYRVPRLEARNELLRQVAL